MDAELLASLESLSLAFSRADPECLAPLSKALADLRSRAIDPAGAEELATLLAAERLINVLPLLSHHCPELHGLGQREQYESAPHSSESAFLDKLVAESGTAYVDSPRVSAAPSSKARGLAVSTEASIRPIVDVLRVLQVLLARSLASKDTFLQGGGLDALATIADRLISTAWSASAIGIAAAGDAKADMSAGQAPVPATSGSSNGAGTVSASNAPSKVSAGNVALSLPPEQPPIAKRKSRSVNRSQTSNLTLSVAPLLPPAARMAGPGLHNRTPRTPATPLSGMPLSSPPPTLVIPDDHEIALAKILQVLGNFCTGGRLYQKAVWDRCFPGTFSRLSSVQSWRVLSPLCMVVFSCCNGSPEVAEELASAPEGIALLCSILRLQSNAIRVSVPFPVATGPGNQSESGMDEWLSLLTQKLCILSPHFPSIFKSLPLSSAWRASMPDNAGAFCPEQCSLLWLLWGELYDSAFRRGVLPSGMPSEGQQLRMSSCVGEALESRAAIDFLEADSSVLEFLVSVTKDAMAAAASLENRASAGQAAESAAAAFKDVTPKMLRLCLQVLRFLPSDARLPSSEHLDPVSSVGSSSLIPLLLDALRGIGPPAGAIPKEGAAAVPASFELPEERKPLFPSSEPYDGFRRDVVAVVGNLCYRRVANQDAVRTQDGLLVVLQQCVVDEKNPLLREWGLWAMRNILEGNEANRKEVSALQVVGEAENTELTEMGIRVVVDPTTKQAKLENVGTH